VRDVNALLHCGKASALSGLFVEPSHDCTNDVVELRFAQRPSDGDSVPFLKARAAAGRGRVLGDEDRMAPHRRLTPVIEGLGWRQALGDQLACMLGDNPKPTLGDIAAFLRA
jgi:hypothetical protein